VRKDRRKFLKVSGITGLSLASGLGDFATGARNQVLIEEVSAHHFPQNKNLMEDNVSIIGQYGPWAASRNGNTIPEFSFRRKEWPDLAKWRTAAVKRTMERMAIPGLGKLPEVKVLRQHDYDGLHIEELSWQLPYGRATEGILLKPLNSNAVLPGILAFHDHGGNKYFGTRKITRTGEQHPMMTDHQRDYYEGNAWANEIAKRGYIVLVTDAFTFGSRRVMLQDVPIELREGLTDDDPENQGRIDAYNRWAGNHEHIMAKSLFSAGTTWPGVFFAEDRAALDILMARKDVDKDRIGCAGLSGGGLRTVLMGGLDHRIKCSVTVGFMTTWKDFILNKSYTHTWMAYVPLLPNELDFPEILGLRTPLPSLVLNDADDFLYTLPEMKRADQILKEVYRKANAEENYQCSFYPGPHKFDRKMQAEAFAWFDKWLKR
jgi:dienelactone hydrolase